MKILDDLKKFEKIPTGASDDLIDKMFKVMYAAVPSTDYDVEDMFHLQLHT